MSYQIDETHALDLKSWVESANEENCDFPIQNLPFGRFKREGDSDWSIGVAIGNQVLDLRRTGLLQNTNMNQLMRLPTESRQMLRQAISSSLRHGSADEAKFRSALVLQSDVEMGLPCQIGDYTDFYTSIHHATNVGRLFRPDNPLLPNYQWVPIGYHGRVSSICVSGNRFARPKGQIKLPASDAPVLAPCARLDYELELGIFVSRPNIAGESIPMEQAESHVFGVALFNDWSARDIQAWEYQPLGPFLSKNFSSTLSPWIVTMDALAPFRAVFQRAAGEPEPLPYLDSQANRDSGAIDITLEVWLQTDAMHQRGIFGDRLSCSNYRDAYWTLAQLVTHHTVNGCNLKAGDLFGTGTLSGPHPDQSGSLLELTQGGKNVVELSNGETRTWLEDGDTVILKAFCQRDGYRRIGFGECRGTVLPAHR